MNINGEAIYQSTYWNYQNDSQIENEVWYTQSKDRHFLFAISLMWPEDGTMLKLNDVVATDKTKIYLLGHTEGPLDYKQYSGYLIVKFPFLHTFISECGQYCQWGYTLKITHFQARTNVEIEII